MCSRSHKEFKDINGTDDFYVYGQASLLSSTWIYSLFSVQTNLAGVEGAAEPYVNVVFEKFWIIFDRLRHCYRGSIRHAAVE